MGGRVERTPMDTNLWSNLPRELLHQVFAHLPISRIYDLRELSHKWMKEVDKEESRFNRVLAEVPKFPTKLGRMAQDLEKTYLLVYDLKTRRRKRNLIEIPLKYSGPEFYADGGLVCLFSGTNEILVLNPLTKQMRQLPPLPISSPPALVKLEVNRKSKQYRLFVVVNNYPSDPSDPSHTEVIAQVYSSQTKEWAIMTSDSEQLTIVGCRYDRAYPIVYWKGRLQDFSIHDIVRKDVSIKFGPVCFHQDRIFVMESLDTNRGRFASYQIGEYKLLENGSGWVQEATLSCDELVLDFYDQFVELHMEIKMGAAEGFLFLSHQVFTSWEELRHLAWLYELSTGDWFKVPVEKGVDEGDGDYIFGDRIFELNSSAIP